MNNFVTGPSYEEMLHPELLPSSIRGKALTALDHELDPPTSSTLPGDGRTIRSATLCFHGN